MVPADPAVVAAIRGPWFVDVDNVILTATFNADGTFMATISTPNGVTSDAGTYTVTGPVKPSPFLNPQGHLSLTNSAGIVLIDGDVLLFKPDQFEMTDGTDSSSPLTSFGLVIWAKFAA